MKRTRTVLIGVAALVCLAASTAMAAFDDSRYVVIRYSSGPCLTFGRPDVQRFDGGGYMYRPIQPGWGHGWDRDRDRDHGRDRDWDRDRGYGRDRDRDWDRGHGRDRDRDWGRGHGWDRGWDRSHGHDGGWFRR